MIITINLYKALINESLRNFDHEIAVSVLWWSILRTENSSDTKFLSMITDKKYTIVKWKPIYI